MVAKREQKQVAAENLDLDARVNPSTGLIARNPTRLDITDTENQREIIEQVRAAHGGWKKLLYDYVRDEEGNWEYSGLPGTIQIREMREEELAEYFRTLMRSRPSVTSIELSLGEYPDKKEYTGPRVSKLQFSKPRNPTEVAEDMASLFSMEGLHVVEMKWQINSAGAGNFHTSAKAYTVSEEDYKDDEKFSPSIVLEYVQF